jgi:hypothetical protein
MLDCYARNRAIDGCGDVSLKRGRPEAKPGKERGHRFAPGQPSDGKEPCRDSRPCSPLPGNGMPGADQRRRAASGNGGAHGHAYLVSASRCRKGRCLPLTGLAPIVVSLP